VVAPPTSSDERQPLGHVPYYDAGCRAQEQDGRDTTRGESYGRFVQINSSDICSGRRASDGDVAGRIVVDTDHIAIRKCRVRDRNAAASPDANIIADVPRRQGVA
jgi:hypothetical protein